MKSQARPAGFPVPQVLLNNSGTLNMDGIPSPGNTDLNLHPDDDRNKLHGLEILQHKLQIPDYIKYRCLANL